MTQGALVISGAGGGKGSAPSNHDNTRRTNARARVLDLLGEGEWEGFIDPEGNLLPLDNIAKAVYLDTTPIQNMDASYNFDNVTLHAHVGLPDEGSFPGHSAVETPTQVEVRVRKDQGPVQRQIFDENADAVRVIMRIPTLVQRDEKKGNLKRTSVSYAIDVRAHDGEWREAIVHHENNQKAMSPYQIAHRISLPRNGSPWDLRVRRLTNDSSDDDLQNETWWESYTVLVEGQFIYPNSAIVGLEVSAEDVGSTLPPRRVRGRALRTLIPSNYNPVSRTYNGIWDGTFKKGWHNNPVWVFFDLLINDRYGLGEFIDINQVDKWSLYTIAQYCDQMVKSGYKNGDTGADIMEPRFTYNGQIDTREEAFFVLQQVTNAWRGMAYWAVGQVFASADMPADPVRLVTPANVIGGEFNYSGTALKARHSVVITKFNDKNNFYRPDFEVSIDPEALVKWGWREKTVQLYGCTSRGQARRHGNWILDVEQNETETVTYSASLDHAQLKPGEIIAIADPRKAQVRAGGRIARHDGLTVTLDAPFEALEGSGYSLMLTMPDGSIERRDILAFLDEKTVRLATDFSQQALPDAVWAITGTDVTPRQFRVLSVKESEPNIFEITALFHDPQKYARVEDGFEFEPLPYSREPGVVPPPTGLRVSETGYISDGQSTTSLLLSWTPPANTINRGFLVTAEAPDGEIINLGVTQGTSMELRNSTRGRYVFSVQTINFAGVMSKAATFEYEAMAGAGFATPTVTGLGLADSPDDKFHTPDARIVWRNNFSLSIDPLAEDGAPAHVVSPHYSHNIVRITNAATGQLLRTQRVTGESFTYTFAMNQADNLALGLTTPARSIYVEVRVYDVYGRASSPVTRTFTNPVPKVPGVESAVNASTIYLWLTPDESDLDYKGLLVWRSTTRGFDPLTTNPIYDGRGTSHTLVGEELTNYYFRFAAYDDFGKTGLNISPEMAISTQAGIDLIPPARPTGLQLSTRIEKVDGVAQRMILVAQWSPSPDSDLAYYDVQIKQGTGNFVAFSTATPRYEWTVFPEQTYEVNVRAVDQMGNSSNYTISASILTPKNDALATIINAGNVAIDGGKIRISGTTTLADWRRGGDETKIDGGAVSANTISANKLEIGSRNISLQDIVFDTNSPAVNRVSWASGFIHYTDDAGAKVSQSINAGSTAAWTSGTIFIYWIKDESSLRSTTSAATAFGADRIVLATYRGGLNLTAEYGRTIIDGGVIKTGTIQAAQIGANAIKANLIDTDAVQTRHLLANAVKAEKIDSNAIQARHIAADAIEAGKIKAGAINTQSLIVDGVVITNKLAQNAVTQIVTSRATNNVPGGINRNNMRTILTASINSIGGRVVVDASARCEAWVSGNTELRAELWRNGSRIYRDGWGLSISSDDSSEAHDVVVMQFSCVDWGAGIGVNNYELRVSGQTDTSNGRGWNERYIFLRDYKR